MIQRIDGRQYNELRPIEFKRDFTQNPAGSILVSFGNTIVLCTASIEEETPRFLKGTNRGWVTAEYSLLPGSSKERVAREAVKGRQSGRTQEIQRLIGRAIRSAVDLDLLGERQIILDCDVLQADGGTRCASICGAYLALCDAVNCLVKERVIEKNPILESVAAVSVGVLKDECILDLNYFEDSQAEVDMNVCMVSSGKFVEIQGTSERAPFSKDTLNVLLDLAEAGINEIFKLQGNILSDNRIR